MCCACNEVLQAVDGWWNADAAECQHRRLTASADTGDVVIQTQIGRDVNAEQTNTAAGNGSVGT